MMPKRDHERDVELDKKIEALRRKNEALMKRYKVRTSARRQRSPKSHWSSSGVEMQVWDMFLFCESLQLFQAS